MQEEMNNNIEEEMNNHIEMEQHQDIVANIPKVNYRSNMPD